MARHPRRQKSLYQKLLLLLILLTIFPIMIIFSIVYTQQERLISNTISGFNSRELQQVADHINSTFSQVISTSTLYFTDPDIHKTLQSAEGGSGAEMHRARQIQECIGRYSSNISGISYYCAILDMDGNAFGTALNLDNLSWDILRSRSWFAQFERSSMSTLWVTDEYLDQFFVAPQTDCIYLIRQLKNLQTWDTIGLLLLAIPNHQIVKQAMGYLQNYQNLYIISDAAVIASLDMLNFGESYFPDFPEIKTAESCSFVTHFNRRPYLISSTTLSRGRWKIITITDYSEPLQAFSSTKLVYLVMVLLYIFAACFLSVYFSRRFLSPIRSLHTSMKQVQAGNMQIRASCTSADEIGDLAFQFNDMLDQINTLMDNVLKEQQAKQKSEMLALQAQINPHFIYNTLASVRYLIQANSGEDADAVILDLIKIMKNTISNPEQQNTVQKEVDLLRSYIAIQQHTFAEPVRVFFEISDEIRDCRVLKLILQPIVENALQHGLKPKGGDAELKIIGEKVQNDIVFQVMDNGIGFDVRTLREKPPEDNLSNGIGLGNVQNRLFLHYGAQYVMKIDSIPGHGTTVTIRFPYQREEPYLTYEHFGC